MTISIQDQIKCVQREIEMRKKVYPNSVLRGKMTVGQKDKEIAAMTAVLNTLMIAERTHILEPFNQPQEKNNATTGL